MSAPLLQGIDLFCERDDRILFDGLSFSLEPGQLLQIAGANGSGKTTLLRIIGGLNRNYEGQLHWQGQPLARVRDEFLAGLLYFGHQPGVKGLLTPRENLHWYCGIHPNLERARISEALAAVGLQGYEQVPCHSLSAGQNRRVSLARLYMSQAPLWVLDEPFTAIDKQGVQAKEQLLAAHIARGGSVIITTHHDLASHLAVTTLNLEKWEPDV